MSDDPGRPVLALNVGSSSFKFDFFMVGANGRRVLLSGAEETLAEPQAGVARIAQRLEAQGLPAPFAVGHRIVHRGPQCRRHTLIAPAVMRQLGSDLPPRLVIAHLGHGSSVTAVARGASVDTVGWRDHERTLR